MHRGLAWGALLNDKIPNDKIMRMTFRKQWFRRSLGAAILSLLCPMGAWAAGCGQVKPDATDAVAAAPVHHKVVLENDVVRVLDVTVPLYSAEPPHTHFWPSVFFEQTSGQNRTPV